MKEYLVLLRDEWKSLICDYTIKAKSFSNVRWAHVTFDMISYAPAQVASMVIICLSDGSYKVMDL